MGSAIRNGVKKDLRTDIDYKMRVDLGVEVTLFPYGHGVVVSYVAGSRPTRWEIKLDNGNSVFAEADDLQPGSVLTKPSSDTRKLTSSLTQEQLLKYYILKLK